MAESIVKANGVNRPLLVSIPENYVQALIQAVIDLSGEGEIRTTSDGRFSVFDLVEQVAGKSGKHEVWKRLAERNPEVLTLCEDFQFPGAGQRRTPVTDLAGCVEIIWLLPGETAKKMRRVGAQITASAVKEISAQSSGAGQMQSTADMLLMMANGIQQMAMGFKEHSDRLERLEVENSQLKHQVFQQQALLNEWREIQTEAHKELIALPPAKHEVPTETTDMKVRRIVNTYAAATGIQQAEVYRNLYVQHYYRYRRRPEQLPRESKLQCFVRLGLIESLYDLAIELFGQVA